MCTRCQLSSVNLKFDQEPENTMISNYKWKRSEEKYEIHAPNKQNKMLCQNKIITIRDNQMTIT